MSPTGPWRPDPHGRARGGGPPRNGSFYRPRRGAPPATLENPASRNLLDNRLKILEVAVVVLISFLMLCFWRLQVVHGSYYRGLAENNRLRHVVLRAPRGLVIDRHGELLAANRPAYNVALVREEVEDRDATFDWLGRVLEQPVAELEARLARHRGMPNFQPVVIAEDVSLDRVATIEARQREFPGVLVQVEPKRYYPHGSLAAHLLGHVGEITREQLDSWGKDRFRQGDIVGQNGLEKAHNEALSGSAGERLTVVNSAGRTVRILNEVPPRPGKTLVLTLDLDLQRKLETQLLGRRGAGVILDVRTGGVLAMASAPSYDPNLFASRFSVGGWQALINDPSKPLQNRALQSAYPPGSIFKLVVAVAALEGGAAGPATTIYCPGGRSFFGHYFRCWQAGGHGALTLQEALAHSCNVYFYELGRRLGREPIVEVARRFGLGSPTGIDLPDEGHGILPTEAWLAKSRSGRWFPGETIMLATGQGAIGTTPLQLTRMAALLGTGLDVRPHLVEREEPAAAPVSATDSDNPRPSAIGLDPATQRAVLRGMWGSVNANGTGWRARHPQVQVGGKTGTAQVVSAAVAGPQEDRPERLRNHAWFVGLAPLDRPEVAVAILVEHGGEGGSAAAPVAGSVLSAYFGQPRQSQPAADSGNPTGGGGQRP